jgi:peptidyl-prolyl cis-trans isomerase SurA
MRDKCFFSKYGSVRKQASLIAVFLMVLVLSPPAFGKVVNRIVAIVNGEVITLYDVERESKPLVSNAAESYTGPDLDKAIYKLKRRVLETMIDQKLAREQIQKIGIKAEDSDIDKAIEQIKRDNSLTQEQLIEQLKKEGGSLEDLRQKLREQVEQARLVDHQVRSRIVITDEQLKAYYEQNKDQFTDTAGTNRVRLKNILIPIGQDDGKETVASKEKLAREVAEQIQSGASFEELAQKYSQGPGAAKGGDLGAIEFDDLAPYLKNAIAPLHPGQVTDVISGPYGFQIFKVEQKQTAGGVRSFEDVKEEIRKSFYNQQISEKYEAWLKELRETAYIKINF